MPRTFDCPKCGAPVSFVPESFSAQATVRCNYCNSILSLPDERHGQPARVVSVRIAPQFPTKFPKWLWLLLAIPILSVLIGVVAMLGALAPLIAFLGSGNKDNSSRPTDSRGLGGTIKDANSFAREILRFGSEGIGPGMFNDARSIGLDAEGNIYVGEYTGGRVQVFDPSGKFLTQWSVDPKMPLRGLTADRQGRIYIAQKGQISRYEGKSGSALGQLQYEDGFDDVNAMADGGLVCAWTRNRDDIVRFDANGRVSLTIPKAISSATGDSELNTRVAADGMGNIYALGTFNDGVFRFSREGKFVNRFGSDGDKPGQFRAPSAVAVDGKGRVYVSDTKGIQVFDSDGRYIDVIKLDGHAFGMTFNDRNELFVIARNHVIKFVLNQ
jgi:sugar lactone lactonase YvrE